MERVIKIKVWNVTEDAKHKVDDLYNKIWNTLCDLYDTNGTHFFMEYEGPENKDNGD